MANEHHKLCSTKLIEIHEEAIHYFQEKIACSRRKDILVILNVQLAYFSI